MNLLEMDKVDTYYGVSHILFEVSIKIQEGSITGLLGRNGVGKTTTLKTILGLTPPKNGTIRFKGEETQSIPCHQIANKGIAYVPDNRQIFAPLSVYENLIIGVPKVKRRENPRWNLERIYELFPVLKRVTSKRGSNLSGGEQRMLAIGRALMCDPDLLLLDEPTEGLAPIVVQTLGEVILNIKKEGVTILLADQNINFVHHIIDDAYIIDKGRIECSAPMQEIWQDKELIHKYLAV